MGSKSSILEQAMSLVDQELSYLREEQCAYERFRERVRLATPDSADATGPSGTTEQLFVAYREEIMEVMDHKTVYGDTLAESLEAELSPAIAELIVSKGPLTHRRKRNLLVKTAVAIERREQFVEEIEEEREALQTFADNLAEIEETTEELPACSLQSHSLEKTLVVWEGYETLLERCKQLLERRQQQIQGIERSVRISGEKHARNEFLYSDLETQWPVLSSIAATCERIDAKRKGEQSNPSPDRSIQY